MAYIAQKPCHLAGQAFYIGDIVPDEVIHPGNAKNLLKMGIIALHGGELLVESGQGTIEEAETPAARVIIHAEEGDMPLELTEEGLQAVVDVLTAPVADAEAIVKGMTDMDALILLDATDKRKSVQGLAKARALELGPAQEEEESAGEL